MGVPPFLIPRIFFLLLGSPQVFLSPSPPPLEFELDFLHSRLCSSASNCVACSRRKKCSEQAEITIFPAIYVLLFSFDPKLQWVTLFESILVLSNNDSISGSSILGQDYVKIYLIINQNWCCRICIYKK